jgi:hypothetical protein
VSLADIAAELRAAIAGLPVNETQQAIDRLADASALLAIAGEGSSSSAMPEALAHLAMAHAQFVDAQRLLFVIRQRIEQFITNIGVPHGSRAVVTGTGSPEAAKREIGSRHGHESHHVVEQSQASPARSGFPVERINTTDNLAWLPVAVHRRVSARYSRKEPRGVP